MQDIPYAVLAVDAGNTKTIAVTADFNGQILGWGTSGCGDVYNAGEAALENIDIAVGQAIRSARGGAVEILSAAFTLAGADWPEDKQFLYSSIAQKSYSKSVAVMNDGLGAVRGGTRSGFGVAALWGTYASTAARSTAGEWHSSFWLPETGGARQMGRDVLRAVFREELGIGVRTCLTQMVLRHFEFNSIEAVLHQQNSRRRTALDTGNLAKLAIEAAENGDPAALEIIATQAQLVFEYSSVAAQKVGFSAHQFDLALTGGIFKNRSTLFIREIKRLFEKNKYDINITNIKFAPVLGALLFAYDKLDRNELPKSIDQINFDDSQKELFFY